MEAQKYANQAMVVTLNISRWTATKTDKRVTDDAVTQNGAESGAGRFTKRLISKNDEDLKAINQAASQLRQFHREMTMPWDGNGRDLLPAKAFLKYKSRMTNLEADFNSAVTGFLNNYREKVNRASVLLGHMFNSEDYPNESDLRGCYSIELKVEPVPLGVNLKVGISEQYLEEERAKIEEDVMARVRKAHQTLYRRLQNVAERTLSALTREGGQFKSTYIKNVKETADILEMLDLEGDKKLKDSAERLREAVNRHGYHKVKDDEEARKEVVQDIESELERINQAVDEMA